MNRTEGFSPAERSRPESMVALLECGYSAWHDALEMTESHCRSLSKMIGTTFCHVRFILGRTAPGYASLVAQGETKGFISTSPVLYAAYEKMVTLPDRSRLVLAREERDLVSISLFPPA